MVAQPKNSYLKKFLIYLRDINKPLSLEDLENKLILPTQHLTKVKTLEHSYKMKTNLHIKH